MCLGPEGKGEERVGAGACQGPGDGKGDPEDGLDGIEQGPAVLEQWVTL